jgi:hypothetical protein
LGVLDEILESWDYDEEGNPALQPGYEAAARMRKYSDELAIYVANNAASIVNYGLRVVVRRKTAFSKFITNHRPK